jgi:hypothetical protein
MLRKRISCRHIEQAHMDGTHTRDEVRDPEISPSLFSCTIRGVTLPYALNYLRGENTPKNM